MTKLKTQDGIELHWQERGEGPLVVVAVHWSGHPSVFEPLTDQLSRDHRVVTYDARGTGRSTRVGPHDMQTGAADLEAVVNAAGGSAVVVTQTDACNRAIRVAAREPSLIRAIVAPGTVPLTRKALAGADALVASDSVVDAFVEMLGRDYRGAQRTMMTTANPQMTEVEVRERVNLQVAYCPRETALARLLAWRDDDPVSAARQVADRLWILSGPDVGGPWFPAGPKLDILIHRLLPDAHLVTVEEGIVSRPDLTADVVRRIDALTATPAEAGLGQSPI